MAINSSYLKDLLITTKDGDWGKDEPKEGFVPYRVIRGTDFPDARLGKISRIPYCYLDEKTVFRRTLQENDILIETAGGTRDRPTGRTLLVTQKLLDSFDLPVTCASFARFMRVDPDKANPEYVYWYLQNLYANGEMWKFQVQHTGIARFQFTNFAQALELPLPNKDEQRRIAHILGTLDDKIELNRRQNETLESLARALFQSWFVDFDPVRAKASGEAESAICQRLGLSQQVLALFPAALEDSSLGEIPAGWEVSTIGAEVGIVGGGTPSTKNPEFWDEGIYDWATPKDLSGLAEPILLGTERRITEAGLAKISSGFLPRGTVLMSSRAPVGYLAINAAGIAINQGFIAMVCNRRLSEFYMLFWCKQNMDSIKSRASGTTFLEISKGSFRPMQVLVPSAELMERFSETAESVFLTIETNLKESRTLAALRDELLPHLLSEEINSLPSF